MPLLERLFRPLVLSVLCATLLPGRLALAQPTDSAMIAESLYSDGKRLFDKGEHGEACPKLAESQRLDPAGGTALLLATCYEKQGKTASAYLSFRDAKGLARRDGRTDREKYADERAKALEAVVPKLNVRVSKGTAALSGLVVKRDDLALLPAAFVVDLMLDPGAHSISAEAPGYLPFTARFEVKPGALSEVSIPDLAAALGSRPRPRPRPPLCQRQSRLPPPRAPPSPPARGRGRSPSGWG
jgi:tetratricopeptide (TPR) repeat protein